MVVPVGQHPAFAVVSVDHVLVAGRPVRVAVDQARVLVRAERRLHRRRRDIHDGHVLDLLGLLALAPHFPGHAHALSQRLGEESLLPGGIAHHGAKLLVFDVVAAQRVAVHQQRARAVQVDDGRVVQQLHAARQRETFADQEIAIAVHEVDRNAAVRQCAGTRPPLPAQTAAPGLRRRSSIRTGRRAHRAHRRPAPFRAGNAAACPLPRAYPATGAGRK